MFYKQTFRISRVCITQKVNAVTMRKLQHIFYVKKKIFKDSQIRISVPLISAIKELGS